METAIDSNSEKKVFGHPETQDGFESFSCLAQRHRFEKSNHAGKEKIYFSSEAQSVF